METESESAASFNGRLPLQAYGGHDEDSDEPRSAAGGGDSDDSERMRESGGYESPRAASSSFHETFAKFRQSYLSSTTAAAQPKKVNCRLLYHFGRR